MKMLLPIEGRLTYPHEYTPICDDTRCVPMEDESQWVKHTEEFYKRKSEDGWHLCSQGCRACS
jgi:hypothetical protein